MSGGGGGSSGQVSYPEYLQVFHRFILDGSATDVLANSITDAMNAAYGSSPYTGATVVDPSSYLTLVRAVETELQSEIVGYVPLTDYAEAHAAVIALYTLDTSPLESATVDTTALSVSTTNSPPALGTAVLSTASADSAPTKDTVTTTSAPTKDAAPAKDVATLDVAPAKDVAPVAIQYTATPVTADTIDIDETAFAADVQTYADQLRADIENNVLPRYKAGMLNVNAITSSAFVIGEALIWAEYDRNVARYAAELRSKLTGSNDQYAVQLKIAASTQLNERVTQAQRLTAQENLAVREENRLYNLAFREENRSYKLATKDETKSYNLAFRDENRMYTLAFRDENKTYKVTEKEEGRVYNLAFREENRTYKLAASQQNAQFKVAHTGETKDLYITHAEEETRLILANSEENTRFKLANTDETVKLKLAASEQNMRFKLQKNELDASHKLNRQKNVLLATAEVVRMLGNRVEFQRIRLDESIKVNALQITALNEQIHEQLVIDEADAKWDLETFQYAANLMAGISGGTSQNQKKVSKAVSALGGALSGAALGAAVGGPYAPITAAAGAVIGGVASYLTA